jgi:accessory gene regulator B
MMRSIPETLTERLMEWQIVKDEDRELYTYGFRQGAVLIFNLIIIIAAGLLFNMLWQSLVFTAAYAGLRTSAGGYHARTQRDCNILSVFLIIAVLCALKWIPWSGAACLIAVAVARITVLVLAPVEDENKPLDETETVVYRKRSRSLFLLWQQRLYF